VKAVKAADPSPEQRVRGWSAVEKIPLKQIRSYLPRQFERENANARASQTRMIDLKTVTGQFARPNVAAVDPVFATHRCIETLAQINRGYAMKSLTIRDKAIPYLLALLEPAFPVRAPDALPINFAAVRVECVSKTVISISCAVISRWRTCGDRSQTLARPSRPRS
jgi:hypothetical protein